MGFNKKWIGWIKWCTCRARFFYVCERNLVGVFRARMKILVLMDISGNDSGYFDTKKMHLVRWEREKCNGGLGIRKLRRN